MKKYIASLSYGKDSIAMLEAIRILNLPLTDIVTVDVWFDRETPADVPEVIEFKKKIDKRILDDFGIEVLHMNDLHGRLQTFAHGCFYKYSDRKNNNFKDVIKGFPGMKKCHWCNSLKTEPLKKYEREHKDCIKYIGYALDEKKRKESFEKGKQNYQFPLFDIGWTEAQCMEWCKNNDVLSPIYTNGCYRDGCWFCPFKNINAKRMVFHQYPDLWNKLLELDMKIASSNHSPKEFEFRHSTMDYDKRFRMEDDGIVPMDKRFRWSMLDECQTKIEGW